MIIKTIAKTHNKYQLISIYIYNASIASILIGLLFSRAMISIGFISFAANWIIEGKFKKKWQVLRQNKSLAIISFIFLIYLAAATYSFDNKRVISNLTTALLILLPLFYFSLPKLRNTIYTDYLIPLFVITLFTKTIILYIIFESTIEYSSLEDLYKINFYSNIRLALFTVFSIFYLLYQNLKTNSIFIKLLSSIVSIWLIYFLYFLGSLTGYVIFFVLVIFSIYFYLVSKKPKNYIIVFTLLTSSLIIALLGFMIYHFINFQKKDIIDFNSLPKTTINGNLYEHDTLSNLCECGHYVNLYVCRAEMRKEWNKKSKLIFDEVDLKGQKLENTLKRYLSSKNLSKDSIGISNLSFSDIKHIENGCANYLYTKKNSLKAKLYLIWWQLNIYFSTGDASNQSISQRLEYYKVSFYLIKKNFWFGVGTGALYKETIKLFSEINSKMDKKYWYYVHNQFIYVLACFGIIGFIPFVFLFFYPLFLKKIKTNFLFIAFYIIIILSFLTDNTLETQLGIGFFSIFYCMLLTNNSVYELS